MVTPIGLDIEACLWQRVSGVALMGILDLSSSLSEWSLWIWERHPLAKVERLG